MGWIVENIGTIVVLLCVIMLVFGILRVMKNDRAKGKSPCGCGCKDCAMRDKCHSKS